MNGEVNVDFEDVLSIVTNGTYSITPVESGSEWLTTSCVKSAYDEISKCLDDFSSLLGAVKGYIDGINDISEVIPPDIEDVVSKKSKEE